MSGYSSCFQLPFVGEGVIAVTLTIFLVSIFGFSYIIFTRDCPIPSQHPESRIREYCAIEIYRGYDDRHNINDVISQKDIDAANNLYAMIDRYGNNESKRLLSRSERISKSLSKVPNKDIFATSQKE